MALVAALFFAALLCSATASSHCEDQQGVDMTLEEEAVGAAVVDATARKIRESGIFEANDHLFLRRMAAVETNNGERFVPNTGGIWSVDNGIFKTVQTHISGSSDLQSQFERRLCFSWSMDILPKGYRAMDIPLYSALYVMVYLVYVRETVPDNIAQQASLWIKVFDRAGTVEEFTTASRSIRGMGRVSSLLYAWSMSLVLWQLIEYYYYYYIII